MYRLQNLSMKIMKILKKFFIGVFSFDHITCFINFYRIIWEKGSLYLFTILNNDKSSQPGTQC